ncbi:S1 family peptidase [Streptomyces sp. NPDC060085]|uniref:S1 family peptidase n=1 Tax=Streptomyces sp. NPDC060085 TaxID=3347054 RepID=UPI00364CB318
MITAAPASLAFSEEGSGSKEEIPYSSSEKLPYGFTSLSALMKTQDTLDEFAHKLSSAAESIKDPGYSSVEISIKDRQVIAHWKGEPVAAVKKILENPPAGFSYKLLQAHYSHTELIAAQQKFVRQVLGDKNLNISGVYPLPDGNGLGVKYSGEEKAARNVGAVSAAKVSVKLNSGQKPHFTFGRYTDTSPYWGGAVYQTIRNNQAIWECSTAFPVKDANGKKLMLSAAHCVNQGDTVAVPTSYPTHKDPAKRKNVGVAVSSDMDHDTALLDMGSLGAKIYRGPAGSNASEAITGWSYTSVGDLLCTSGAASGEHCYGQVESVDTSMFASFPGSDELHSVEGLAWATSTTNSVLSAGGDSGGPVFNDYGSGIKAKGTTSMHSEIISCGATYSLNPNLQCSTDVYYLPMDFLLNRWGVDLITS